MPIKHDEAQKMIACLYSGGKDSTMALHKAAKSGDLAELLITMVPENDYSYMFHKPNVKFTAMQAEAMGIRHVFASTPGEKEEELGDLEAALKNQGITKLITGATASEYQKSRIAAICDRLSITMVSPLWKIEPISELEELASKYDAIITRVAAEGFGAEMLGERIDANMIAKLIKLNERYGTHLLFEGGEAESFVLDAPLFSKRIVVDEAERRISGSAGDYVIKKAHLAPK